MADDDFALPLDLESRSTGGTTVSSGGSMSGTKHMSKLMSTIRVQRQKRHVPLCKRLYRMWGWILVTLLTFLYCYAYAFVVCVKTVRTDKPKLFGPFIGVFAILAILFKWSFWTTAFTRPKDIPGQFRFTNDELRMVEDIDRKARMQGAEKDGKVKKIFALELEPMALKRRIRTRTKDKAVNYCLSCYLFKPERSHHCRKCDACVPRMDHHCPMFNNCIHWGNHKSFVLSLFYGVSLATFCLISTIAYMVSFGWMKYCNTMEKLAIYVMFFFCGLTMFLIWPFLTYHLCLLRRNQTHIENRSGGEHFVGGKVDTFNLGSCCANYQQVFGLAYCLWCVPVFTTPGDGMYFITKSEFETGVASPVVAAIDAKGGVRGMSVLTVGKKARV